MPSSPTMTFKNPNSIQRRKLLLHHGRTSSVDSCITPRRNTNVRFGEVCGGTTADVTAVCCCGPFVLANLAVVAVYKVPVGLCRRAIRQKRLRKLEKKGSLQPRSHIANFRGNDGYFQLDDVEESEETQQAVLELENEMWQKFYGAGFWRTTSLNERESPRFQVQPL